jgi:oxygen-independent coproporphyrinogen-3 oxidase
MTDADREYDLLDELTGPTLPSHLYLHIPFCASRCAYCDFFSTTDLRRERVLPVTAAIIAEATQWSMHGLPGVLETVYFGGGTPTVLGNELPRAVSHILDRFPVRKAAEVTVEANPDSLTPRLVEGLAAAGVTRMSLGVQSFVDAELRLLGRRHDALAARAAAELVAGSTLTLSIDLICGVPGQTLASWEHTLATALEIDPDHASVYPLAIEPGTAMSAALGAGLIEAPDPDLAADMLIVAERMLGEAGIPRYEVANYAKPGAESRHNTAYWTGRPYIGVGPSAHGMLDGPTAAAVHLIDDPRPGERVRYANAGDIDAWVLAAEPVAERLTAAEAEREDIMLGMRLVRGVAATQVEAAGATAILQGLAGHGLVELVAGRWRTTRHGWLLGNEVFGAIWTGE